MAQEQREHVEAEGRTAVRHVELRPGDAIPSNAAIKGHPLHPAMVHLPIGLLVAGLAADLGHLLRDDPFFARAAALLIGAGALTGYLAALPGMLDWFTIERAHSLRMGKLHAAGNAVLLAVVTVNVALRLSSGTEDAVLPWGLALSLLSGLLLAVTGLAGGELSHRHMVGVSPAGAHRTHTELE